MSCPKKKRTPAAQTAGRRLPFLRCCRIMRLVNQTVTELTDQLIASYARVGGINHVDGKNLPSKTAIASITLDLLRLLFPGFFDEKSIHSSRVEDPDRHVDGFGLGTAWRRKFTRASNTPRRTTPPRRIWRRVARSLTLRFLEQVCRACAICCRPTPKPPTRATRRP